MHKVSIERDLEVPVAQVWEAFDDIGGIYKFHPLVESSPIVNGVERGLGAERICNFKNGDSIRERVTKYKPGKSMTIEITEKGKFPLVEAYGDITVTQKSKVKTRLNFGLRFQPKYGPLGWLMAKLMMKPQFSKIINGVIDELERQHSVKKSGTRLTAATA